MPTIIIATTGEQIVAILIPSIVDQEQFLIIYRMSRALGLVDCPTEQLRAWQCWGAFVRPGYTSENRPNGQTLIFTKK